MISVAMIVRFRFVAGMVMIMRPVLAFVIMIVYVGGSPVGVLVEMFVKVLVGMCVFVLMRMHLAIMGMFMGVRMRMIMRVQMLVLVLSFHC
jgi:hypothetical protein